MAFKVYSGPAGTETISPLNKDHMLFKEFPTFDEALAWAGHMRERAGYPFSSRTKAACISTSARSPRN
jgi:hypothetical protein